MGLLQNYPRNETLGSATTGEARRYASDSYERSIWQSNDKHNQECALEKVLRKEQAGSRQGRSTTEQVIILRNILEQSCEWRISLNAYFVDLERHLILSTGAAYGSS